MGFDASFWINKAFESESLKRARTYTSVETVGRWNDFIRHYPMLGPKGCSEEVPT